LVAESLIDSENAKKKKEGLKTTANYVKTVGFGDNGSKLEASVSLVTPLI
jgi:hypothetical protein